MNIQAFLELISRFVQPKRRMVLACLFITSSFLYLFPHSLFAQEVANKDSLRRIVYQSADDTGKVMALIYLAQHYENASPDSAIYFYSKAGELSNKLNYPEGRLKYIANYTYLLNMKGEYQESIRLNQEAETLARKLGKGLPIGKALTNLANAYLFNQQFELAVEKYQQALPYLEQEGNPGYLSVLYSNLATVYFNMEQYEQSVQICQKGISLAQQVKDSASLSAALLNAGNAEQRLHRYDTARIHFEEGREIAIRMKDDYLLNLTLLGLIELNTATGNIRQNPALLEKAGQLSKQLDDQRSITLCYSGWVSYYFSLKDYTSASQYNDSLTRNALDKNQTDLLVQAYQHKAALAIAFGKPEDYFKWTLKADSLDQALKGMRVSRKVKELEVRYGLLKKEQELEQERLISHNKSIQNTILWITLAALLLIATLLYLYFRQRRDLQTKRILELEKEKQLLAATAILQGQEEERSRLARDLHDSMGGMLSGIKNSFTDMKDTLIMTPDNLQRFEKGLSLLDTSINEFRRVAHNMMPEALQKFGLDAALRDFCAGMNSSNQLRIVYQSYDLEQSQFPAPVNTTVYRVIQELLTNILKHASATEAVVQVSKMDQQLLITVEDNGKGFDTSSLENSAGIGWTNIRNRIAFLKGKLDIQSAPGQGTAVNIEIAV